LVVKVLVTALGPHFLAGQADREKDCNAAKRKSVFPFIKPEKAESVTQNLSLNFRDGVQFMRERSVHLLARFP